MDKGQKENAKPGDGEWKITPEMVDEVFHKAVNEELIKLDPELKTKPDKTE